ncbi:selenocysteine insertion sequence-binding protein 2-like isoform X4 [Ornithorhynchus anatinus]|uniref:selenocysteine insertion sequence-binding protein 2-like isoform X4 n=1 Tax=Ornithorhynchus anatinus TaxID=9258 RepID=UPI0010A8FBF1|nr:selenocysteine insertion sequence-binding protein 2-like isoform X4 [Ornithorhynchus anatinus]
MDPNNPPAAPADQNVKLSAEVEPFVPQKKTPDSLAMPMALPGDGGGVGVGMGGAGAVEPSPIPSYLITCYPFVQESQSNSHHLGARRQAASCPDGPLSGWGDLGPSLFAPGVERWSPGGFVESWFQSQRRRPFPLYNNDLRWQPPSPSPAGPYLAYPLLSAPPPVSAAEYTYYQLMPAPCAQVMGFYHPFPSPHSAAFQTANPVSPVAAECPDRPSQPGPAFPLASQRGRSGNRGPAVLKQPLPQHMKSKRPPAKSVATQKETSASGPDPRSKIVLLVDASQQTDFPLDIANKSLSESGAATVLWKSKGRRRRASHPAAESSSEQGASEADIDSDSGYCSPKHGNNQAAGPAARSADSGPANLGEPSLSSAGVSWPQSAGPATQKRPWPEKAQVASRGGRQIEERSGAQASYRCREHSTSSERKPSGQRRPDVKPSTPSQPSRAEPSPDSFCFEDEDEFPELNSDTGNAKDESGQRKISTKVLAGLPENSPISIVQTPIPITASVPKRAKSQKKKALAAALATAQEYSEISMEQRKLQEALSKAAGKKSKTPVQLDLGDMLAALEKQQQAMKARQITNTRPLSYTVVSAAPFHTKDSGGRKPPARGQPAPPSLNPLDSTAPRVKRGKEREIAKLKRPTALKKIILKEREEKKGRLAADPALPGAEEPRETPPGFGAAASPEETGLSVPSDTSLSPASQNSPYCMTPVSQGSPASSGIGSPMASSAITKIHSKRFREYCNQVLSKEIDECVTLLLQELVSFQERVYQKDPVRAKTRRRLVMGLREVTKHMKLSKIKCVIISPNCEKIQSKGGLDEALCNVIAMAREQEIPFVFALGRKALGRCVNKLVPVSVVGIFNYSGAESLFHKLVALTEEARKAYRDMVAALEQEHAEEALRSVQKAPHHMGHSRNPSAASAISFCSVISEPISEVNEKEYETNWRNMVETCDGPDPADVAREAAGQTPEKPGPVQQDGTVACKPPPAAGPGKGPAGEREEARPDELEWASQQSTETGSLDGSCRDLLNSSITSTTSTLVPGMLEEEQEDEDEDEQEEQEDDDDYPRAPISAEVQLTSRIESWVSETQRTMETLQLGKTLRAGEGDGAERSGGEEEEEADEEEEEEEDVAAAAAAAAGGPEQAEPGPEWTVATAEKSTSGARRRPPGGGLPRAEGPGPGPAPPNQ